MDFSAILVGTGALLQCAHDVDRIWCYFRRPKGSALGRADRHAGACINNIPRDRSRGLDSKFVQNRLRPRSAGEPRSDPAIQ